MAVTERSTLVSEHLWQHLKPHLPSSWERESIGQFGIQVDYINHPNGTQGIIGILWKNPNEPRNDELIAIASTYLPNTKTYRDYCLEELQTDNEVRIKQGQQPLDIEEALCVLVDEIPQARRIDEIVMCLRAINAEELRNRTRLEEILRLMGNIHGLADSPKREKRFLKQYGLTR